MGVFLAKAAEYFFVAFGVVLGGTLLGGISSVLTLQPPTDRMLAIASSIKIWAIVAAIGGTIDPIRNIETHWHEVNTVVKQILWIVSAFMGAHMGTLLIKWICRGEISP